MVDYLHKVYIWSTKLHTPFSKLIRVSVLLFANCFIPVYYRVSHRCTYHNQHTKHRVIASLTSYPGRISKTWLSVESILRQSVKPAKVILWLSKEQFPNGLNDVPRKLRSQLNKGLEIGFVDGDARSHKKYYYCFQQYAQDIVFLADDDIFYPSDILARSLKLIENDEELIVANFGFRYKWNKDSSYIDIIQTNSSSNSDFNVFFGSGGGTMLIPRELNRFIDSIGTIMRICPTADDIYLNGIAHLASKRIVLSSNNPLLSIHQLGESLLDENGSIGNVASRNAEQLRALVSYWQDKYGVNPFD